MQLTPTQRQILAQLEERGSGTVKSFGRALRLDYPSTADALDALKGAGLINTRDRRRNGCLVFFLTAAGSIALRPGASVVVS